MQKKLNVEGWIYFLLFISTVWFANYLITHVGTPTSEAGPPYVIPVGFGLYAPSGVLAVGLSFTLRDLVQRRKGPGWSSAAILIGAVLSAFLSPAIALASGGAFLVSEMLDLVVYTPIQKKNLYLAVVASNTVGVIVDSAVFLFLAFGSLEFLLGQVVGKMWMTLLALPVVWAIRKIDHTRGVYMPWEVSGG